MKQYLSPEQTAKLIELGLEKPCSIASVEPIYGMGGISVAKDYSIGELIEMLDSVNETFHCRFGGVKANLVSTNSGYEKIGGELIDLLFDLCVKLKEEGII
jgi:hypothetical protein